ncbi:hypothetical protein B0H66DRAFT_549793 [Apodospora peruviana]|uniref:Uncharacterized protein n=1 Tax=Apodospora peruviana TaxID=516989 RepID=A0AAE0IJ76_9PEZI|nr:hypothetical protein B0H66DRAFT_549793 [Apodospora peruviana]
MQRVLAPDGMSIYAGTQGFEALKCQPVTAVVVEFLDMGRVPYSDPDANRVLCPHRNHAVMRLQTQGVVRVDMGYGQAIDACGVLCSVEMDNEERCYFAAKPIKYVDLTTSAAAGFSFPILRRLTVRDICNIVDAEGLLPFLYKDAGMTSTGGISQVGCRDWLTQLFCRLNAYGYVGWTCDAAFPGHLSHDFVGTSFAHIIGHRFSGIPFRSNTCRYGLRSKGGVHRLRPIVDQFPLDAATFLRDGVRLLEYNGEVLPYKPPHKSIWKMISANPDNCYW